MEVDDNQFFIKSFNSLEAESFVNKFILPYDKLSLPESAKFVRLEYLTKGIEIDFESDSDDAVKISFTYKRQNRSEDYKLAISLFQIEYLSDNSSSKNLGIGGYDLRVVNIDNWSATGIHIPTKEMTSLSSKLQDFIEIVNIRDLCFYQKDRLKVFLDRSAEIGKAQKDYFDTLGENISEAPRRTYEYCPYCNSTPCCCVKEI